MSNPLYFIRKGSAPQVITNIRLCLDYLGNSVLIFNIENTAATLGYNTLESLFYIDNINSVLHILPLHASRSITISAKREWYSIIEANLIKITIDDAYYILSKEDSFSHLSSLATLIDIGI